MRPTVTSAAEMVYRLLPDYVRAADEATDWATLRFVAALSTGLQTSLDFLTIADPDTSPTGTSQLADPDAIPRAWLPWLGAMLGLDVASMPIDQAREIVSAAGDAQRRGSRNAIKAAVARTLSNPVPGPRVWANLSGDDPYLISVVTNISQTPDETATLLAAWSEKPAGMDLLLQLVEGALIAELELEFPTILELEAALVTVDSVIAWIPTT